MVKADRISGIFWLCFAVLVIVQSYHLGLGTLHKPGPGFLFFWVNIVLAIMSLIVLIRAWTSKPEEETSLTTIFGGQNTSKIIFVMISLFLYALLMEIIGFIPVTLLLFIFLLGIVEKKKWFYTIFGSVVGTVISELIFETWLQSQLPKGLLQSFRF